MPDRTARQAILRVHARRMALGSDVDLDALADSTEYYTGAELEGLCREAAMTALRSATHGATWEHGAEITMAHFTEARDRLPAPLLSDGAVRSSYQDIDAS